MIKRYFKKGLLPALFVSMVLAAAFFAPSRATIQATLTAAANCTAYSPCAIYTGEAYGPLHEDQTSPPIDAYPSFGSALARAAHPAPSGTPGVTAPYSGLV